MRDTWLDYSGVCPFCETRADDLPRHWRVCPAVVRAHHWDPEIEPSRGCRTPEHSGQRPPDGWSASA